MNGHAKKGGFGWIGERAFVFLNMLDDPGDDNTWCL